MASEPFFARDVAARSPFSSPGFLLSSLFLIRCHFFPRLRRFHEQPSFLLLLRGFFHSAARVDGVALPFSLMRFAARRRHTPGFTFLRAGQRFFAAAATPIDPPVCFAAILFFFIRRGRY